MMLVRDGGFNFCSSLVVNNVKPKEGGKIVKRSIKCLMFIHVISSEPSAEVIKKTMGLKK